MTSYLKAQVLDSEGCPIRELAKANFSPLLERTRVANALALTLLPAANDPNANSNTLFLNGAQPAVSPDEGGSDPTMAFTRSPAFFVYGYYFEGTRGAATSPNQDAFAIGSVTVRSGIGNPNMAYSVIDCLTPGGNLGNVYGHPAGSEALFTQPAQVATGLSVPSVLGSISDEEFGSFVYSLYIVATGGIANGGGGTPGRYVVFRRPWSVGSYFGDSSQTDTQGSPALSARFNNRRTRRSMTSVISPSITLPAETQLATELYDTSDTALRICGRGRRKVKTTEVPTGWVVQCQNRSAPASATNDLRGVWAVGHYGAYPAIRLDGSLDGTLPSGAQYRAVAVTRAGITYVAVDGTDEAGTGVTGDGGLASWDLEGMQADGSGLAAETFETSVDGLLENDCLGVIVDDRSSGTQDRLWVMHRGGLSYRDFDLTGAPVGAWATVPFDAAGGRPPSSVVPRGGHVVGSRGLSEMRQLFTVDTTGRVYFVARDGSDEVVGRWDQAGAAYTFYSTRVGVTVAGEVGSFDANGDALCIDVFRADPGDPDGDRFWISFQGTSAASPEIISLDVSAWSSGTPLTVYLGSDVTQTTPLSVFHLSPSEEVFVESATRRYAFLFNGASSFTYDGETGSSNGTENPACIFVDGDAVGHYFTNINQQQLLIENLFSVCYQWDSVGSRWYRRRFVDAASSSGRDCDTLRVALPWGNGVESAPASGLGVTWSFDGGGGDEVVVDENFTFVASHKLFKEADEELTMSLYGFFQRTTEVRGSAPVSAADGTASVAYGSVADLPATPNYTPLPAPTARQGRIDATFQTTLAFDGSNNTSSIAIVNTSSNWLVAAIDLGSAQVVDRLACYFTAQTIALVDLRVQVYGSTDNVTWTLLTEFDQTSPGASWRDFFFERNHDVFHTPSSPQNLGGMIWCDLGTSVVEGRASSNNFRYFKLGMTSASSANLRTNGLGAYAAGSLLGQGGVVPEHADADFMAVVVDNVYLVVGSGTGSVADDGSGLGTELTTTAPAGTSDGDVVRINGEDIVISSVGPPVTLQRRTAAGAGLSYTVYRPTAFSYRQGATSQFPPTGALGENVVFIDPVTGSILFSDDDVANSREFLLDRYYVIRRGP